MHIKLIDLIKKLKMDKSLHLCNNRSESCGSENPLNYCGANHKKKVFSRHY
jgi:hypothetical protein